MQTFNNVTLTSATSRVITAAVAHSFHFPEAKSGTYKGLERGSQMAKFTQQVKAEGKGFESGPRHGDLWGLGREWCG